MYRPLFYYMAKIEELEKKTAEVLAELGLELVDLEYIHAQSAIVRVYMDKEGGVTIDDCANVSDRLGFAFDAAELIDTRYNLEVSSPGLDRKLKKESDFVKYSGQNIKVRLKNRVGDSRNYAGRLKGCENGVILMETATGGKTEELKIELSNIDVARIEPELKF